MSYTTIEIRPENGNEFEYQLCHWLDDIGQPPYVHVYCQQYIKGRHVRLRRDTSGPGSHTLNLCEVQVYGYLFSGKTQGIPGEPTSNVSEVQVYRYPNDW